MEKGECGRTRRGVTYCYIPRLGVRFCPRGAKTADACERAISVSGDRRRGRWERRRVGVDMGAYARPIEV